VLIFGHAGLRSVAAPLFQAYEAFTFRPIEAETLPAIKSLSDHAACVARLRRIMEDPHRRFSRTDHPYRSTAVASWRNLLIMAWRALAP